jgi:hypothetical protein
MGPVLSAPARVEELVSARVRQAQPARDAAMRQARLEYGYVAAAIAREAGVLFDGEQGHREKIKTVMTRSVLFVLLAKTKML